MKLSFDSVLSKDYELDYKLDQNLCDKYEGLISFRRGRDFNIEIREYVEQFVHTFKEYITEQNKDQLNKRLSDYNKLVVDLKNTIFSSINIPSVMISGGANYPQARKNKELERTHKHESELYSDEGKHARFLENTHKMFDPIRIDDAIKVEEMRKKRSEEKGWSSFYQEVEHDEIAGFGIDEDNSRVYIKTHSKPDEETRQLLKKAAMRWSPRNERWQRVLTQNGINAVNRVLGELEIAHEVS